MLLAPSRATPKLLDSAVLPPAIAAVAAALPLARGRRHGPRRGSGDKRGTVQILHRGRQQIRAACRDAWRRGADADTPRDAGLDPEMDRQGPPVLQHDEIPGRDVFCLPWSGREQ